MRATASLRRLILPLCGPLILALPAPAGSNLLDNSPFLPPSSAPGAAQEAMPLELRSILKAGAAYEFSLYDTAKKQSTWVGLNEAGHDFVIKAFDPANETVTVEQRNRTYKLALKEAKIALLNTPVGPGGAVGGLPGAGAAGGGPQPGTGPQFQMPAVGRGPPGPIPTLTPEQLRNLEADINRRRELRRQATVSPAPLSTGQPTRSP
ncbi:MAG TPA: hypothetical protein VLW52_00290 [Opitutaceae bacterium]|nr:hypothetical protein [Opitutaceae bacterium]